MNLEPYGDDGMQVWLSRDEMNEFLSTDALEQSERQLAESVLPDL